MASRAMVGFSLDCTHLRSNFGATTISSFSTVSVGSSRSGYLPKDANPLRLSTFGSSSARLRVVAAPHRIRCESPWGRQIIQPVRNPRVPNQDRLTPMCEPTLLWPCVLTTEGDARNRPPRGNVPAERVPGELAAGARAERVRGDLREVIAQVSRLRAA